MHTTAVYEKIKYKKIISSRKTYIAVIIPVYNEIEYLKEHLEKLNEQTYDKFDIVIVASPILEVGEIEKFIEEKKFKFGIIILQRENDTGSAGGFYLGQKYAFENEYEVIIHADVDAIPIDKKLIENLIKEYQAGHNIVLPRCLFHVKEKVINKEANLIPFYGLISKKVIEKVGLYFAPFYLGFEDAEYALRIEQFFKIKIINNTVKHPYNHAFLRKIKNIMRMSIETINFFNAIISIRKVNNFFLFYYISSFIFFLTLFIFCKDRYLRENLNLIIENIGKKKTGKDILEKYSEKLKILKNYNEMGENFDLAILDKDLKDTYFDILKEKTKKKLYLEVKSVKSLLDFLKRIYGYFFFIKECFRKKVIVLESKSFYFYFLSLMFAKESWIIDYERNLYKIGENRDLTIHILKIIIFFIVFPCVLLFGLGIFPILKFKAIKTLGYGLKKN